MQWRRNWSVEWAFRHMLLNFLCGQQTFGWKTGGKKFGYQSFNLFRSFRLWGVGSIFRYFFFAVGQTLFNCVFRFGNKRHFSLFFFFGGRQYFFVVFLLSGWTKLFVYPPCGGQCFLFCFFLGFFMRWATLFVFLRGGQQLFSSLEVGNIFSFFFFFYG